MTTPKPKLAGLTLIAALCAGFTLGLTAPAWGGWDEAAAAYHRGDYATLVREMRPFAEQGHADAQSILGAMYRDGQGVPQDHAEAMKWYRKAAEQGHAEAQDKLGLIYQNGQGVPRDYAEAMNWYRKAAEQGNAGGQFNLDLMYQNGKGFPQDYAKAHMWLNLATSSLPPGIFRDVAVKIRDDVAKKMTPAQISEAQKLAREWRPKK